MKKLSGWQKVGLFAGIGCFSFVALLVVGFAIAVFYAKSTLAEMTLECAIAMSRLMP